MSKSRRYLLFVKGLTALRHHLLPEEFDPTGTYEPRDLTRALAYRVMAHAEIESYIEERVLELALAATTSCKTNNKISKTIICLLAFSGEHMDEPPAMLSPPANQAKNWDKKIKMAKKIDLAYNAFYNAIEKNHGVREYNLLRLLLPIGVEVDSLDQLWISAMDDFGKLRGDAAHKSTMKYTIQIKDPKIEFDKVKDLLRRGINDLDEIFNQLLSEVS